MQTYFRLKILAFTFFYLINSLFAQHWPSFRGPQASGIYEGAPSPVSWNVASGEGLLWKAPVPGLSHASPVIWEDRIYLVTAVSSREDPPFRHGLFGDIASADDQVSHRWKVLALDRHSGRILWERTAHEGIPRIRRHTKASHANATPATNGQYVVAFFGSEGLYCFDREGNLVWKQDLGVLDTGFFQDSTYQWGTASSPIIFEDLVVVQCDVQEDSFIAAFDLATGREVWRTARDEIPSWGTPTLFRGPEGPEIATNSSRFIRGYEARTGRELWRLSGNSQITTPTPIVAHDLIFVTSGYRPIQPIYAIRLGARGDLTLPQQRRSSRQVAWSTERGGPYMPTPLVYGDHLYVCSDRGVLTVYEARTGRQVAQNRLGDVGGAFTASPVAADGKLYFTSEDGEVFVVRAGPRYELLAINSIGEVCMATPAIADGILYFRGRHHLFAVGLDSGS